MTTITALPTPPTRDDPANFRTRADAFLAALPDFATETNTVAGEVNGYATNAAASKVDAEQAVVDAATQVSLATAQAVLALGHANDAADSAASAINAPGTSATSATSLTIGAGSKSLTITTGKAFAIGQTVVIADSAAPSTNAMTGIITAHDSGTGALTVDVTEIRGSGTISAWTVSLSALRSAIGNGGSTASGNVTLTAGSSGAQSITATAWGQYVTLPDATLLSENAQLFSIRNAGGWPYGIKNSAGTWLGWIVPGETAVVGLADNSTAAGVWTVSNVEKVAVTAETQYALAALTANNLITGTYGYCALDTNRTLLIVGEGNNIYGFVHDNSDNTWGSATLIRSATGVTVRCGVVKSDVDQALVVSCNSTTALEAVVLSVSGKTITVNTAATATLAGNINGTQPIEMVQCGSSFVFWYVRATTTVALRAITISGTTPTIGSETAVTTSLSGGGTIDYISLFAVSSSVALIIYWLNSTTTTAAPYSISGTTVTVGTTANISNNGGTVSSGVSSEGARYWVRHHNAAGTQFAASIVTVTGSVATTSLGGDLYSVLGVAGAAPEPVELGSGKVLFVADNGSGTSYCNILTDTAGTASVGTQLTIVNGPGGTGATSSVALIDGTNAHLITGLVSTSAGAQGHIGKHIIACSGASPTLTSQVWVGMDRTLVAPRMPPVRSRAFRFAPVATVSSGTSYYSVAGGQRGTIGNAATVGLLPESAQSPTLRALPGNASYAMFLKGKVSERAFFAGGGRNGTVFNICQVECAA